MRNLIDISELLALGVKYKASDLHLSAGLPPIIRVDGDIRYVNVPALDHKTVHSLIYDIMNDEQRKDYEEFLDTDFSFEILGLARFRVSVFNQHRGISAVFRIIPSKVLSMEELDCPSIFKKLVQQSHGIILVTGPTNSGKSTTLAAMLDYINNNNCKHILSVENPIEFVHTSNRCIINQREVRRHTLGFNEILRSILRKDPDIILVSAMRNLETICLALSAAEAGQLVFGALPTSSVFETISCILYLFPDAQRSTALYMLAKYLRAIVSQTLLKKIEGGRVAVHEILVVTPAVRNLIREDKMAAMYTVLQTGQACGMQTMDQNLLEVVKKGLVSRSDARIVAVNKENFD